MVSIRQFVGAMLEQITRARVSADAASLRVAHAYLQHDFLKGFGVPAMHVKDVELELTFAVAPGWKATSIFANPDVRLNAVNQLERFVEQLPQHPALKPYFDQDRRLTIRWNAGLPALRERFDRTLADAVDTTSLVPALGLLIENHFYGMVREWRELLTHITRPLAASRDGGSRPAVHQYIQDGMRGILDSFNEDEENAALALLECPDIQMMIGSDELDKVPPERLQRMKIKVSANDRKWVVSQRDGQEVHTLTR